MNALTKFASKVLQHFSITLYVEEGKTFPNYNSFKAQRRLNRKLHQYLKNRDRHNEAEKAHYQSRDELVKEVGKNVRYVEKVIDGHTYRVLLGYDDPKEDLELLAEILGEENKDILDESTEKYYTLTLIITHKPRFKFEKFIARIWKVISKVEGTLKYNQDNPLKKKINEGTLRTKCESRNIPFPKDGFVEKPTARLYIDPVKSLVE